MQTSTSSAVSAFLHFAFVLIFATQYSLLSAQVHMTNKGNIHISGGAMNVKGTLRQDSTGVIKNFGTVKTDVTKAYGTIELKGDTATWLVNDSIILRKGKVSLNNNTLILSNGDTLGLRTHNGRLISKIAWGKIKWKIGERTGIYTIPFADSIYDVSLKVEIIEPGVGASGYLTFSTYGTPNNNLDKPGVLDDFPSASEMIDSNALKIADRYWLLKAEGYSQNPLVKLTLKYKNEEIAGSNQITEGRLTASVLTDDCWQWKSIGGTVNTSTNRFIIDSLNEFSVIILHDSTVSWFSESILSVAETHTNDTCYDCPNGTIDLTVTGGTSPYSYIWSDSDTSEDRSGLAKGLYRVTISDANNCTPLATKEIYISLPSPRVVFGQLINSAEDPNYYEIVGIIEDILRDSLEQQYTEEEEGFIESYEEFKFFWNFRVGYNGTNPGSFLPAYTALKSGNITLPEDCTPFENTPEWKFEGTEVDPIDASCPNTNNRRQNHLFISQLWVDPADHDHVIACSPGSGLWETDGGNWTNISKGLNGYSQLLSYQSFYKTHGFAVKPDETDTIFVATGLAGVGDDANIFTGIYYTTDGGNNWIQDNTFILPTTHAGYPFISYPKITKLKFSPSPNENLLFAIGQGFVFRKDVSDLDNVWTVISVDTSSKFLVYSDIEFDRSNPDNVFICRKDEDPEQKLRGQLFFSNNKGNSGSWNTVGNNFPDNTTGNLSDYSTVKVSIPFDGSTDKVYAFVYYAFGNLFSTGSNSFGIYEADLDDQPNFTWTLNGEGDFPGYIRAVHPDYITFTVSNSKSSVTNNPIIYLPMDFFYFTDSMGNNFSIIDTFDYAFNSQYNDCNRHADTRHLLLVESDGTSFNGEDDLIYLATDGGISVHPQGGCDVQRTANVNLESCFQNLNRVGLRGGSISDIDYDLLDPDYLVFSAIHGHMAERRRTGASIDWHGAGAGDTYQADIFYSGNQRYILYSWGGLQCIASNCTTCTCKVVVSDSTVCIDESTHVVTACSTSNTLPLMTYTVGHKPIQMHPNGNIYLGGHNLMVSSISNNLNFTNISSGNNGNENGYDDIFNPTDYNAADQTKTATNFNGTPAAVGGFNVNESNADVIYLYFNGGDKGARYWSNKLGVIKSENQGATWENLTANFINQNYTPWGGPYDLYSITDITSDPNHPDSAWISFGGFPVDDNTGEFRERLDRVWRTCDGGDTWSDVSMGLPEVPVNKLRIFKYGTDVVFAATALGVYVYVPGSSCFDGHWECINNEFPPATVVDLEIDYCKMQLLAGVNDWGIWSWSIPDELIKLTESYAEVIDDQHPDYNSSDQSVEWNGRVKNIRENIVVKPGYTLKIIGGSVVNMPRTGRIIVERGAKLIVDGSTLTNACGAMWGGIEVRGNTTKDQNGNYAYKHPTVRVDVYDNGYIGSYPQNNNQNGVVLLLNGTLVENAIDAVSTVKRVDWAPYQDAYYYGGIIVAENCTLRNNRRCAEFMEFDPLNVNASRFINCTFETDGKLNNGAPPYAFVSMWRTKGIEFENCTFINQTPSQYSFDKKGIGIISVDALPKISKICQQYNIQQACVQYSDPNVFQNLYTGVKLVNGFGYSYAAVVAGNDFINNFYGVDLQGAVGAQVFKNYIETGTMVNNRHSIGINAYGSYNVKLEENEIVIKQTSPGRGIYFDQSQGAQRIYNNTVSGSSSSHPGMAFAYSFDNSNLVNECNHVDDEMYHFMVFANSSIAAMQGDCRQNIPVSQQKPAGNIFDPTCNTTNLLHFYQGTGAAYFEYCDNSTNSNLDNQCVRLVSPLQPFQILTTNQSASCPSNIIGPGDDQGGFYGKRAEQATLTGLIKDQYALLDGNRTAEILTLVNNEDYSSDQLYDTLMNYTPFLSDDILVASLFREEFKSLNDLSHLLIKNAPHSNLVWKAIDETSHSFNPDSLEKLREYQDSTSARKDIIDSLDTYKLEKALNYADMLYYVSVDTNYTEEEVKDSLENEIDIPFRMLLGELHASDEEYSEADTVYQNLKVYFREDRELKTLRNIQTTLFEDSLTYFDLDSSAIEDIEQIAFNDTSIAAFQAMAILEFLRDTIYPKPYQDIDSGSLKTTLSDLKPLNSEEQSPQVSFLYTLIPTIIDGKDAAFITLGSDEIGYLQLYRLDGKKLSEYKLSSGITQIQLSELNLPQSIYIYRVFVRDELKNTGKIIKVR